MGKQNESAKKVISLRRAADGSAREGGGNGPDWATRAVRPAGNFFPSVVGTQTHARTKISSRN